VELWSTTGLVGISQWEVAERAGVDPEYLARLISVGAIVPGPDGTFSTGDARRARLFRGLERAGLPIETVREAIERGDVTFEFLDLPLYDRFAALSGRSFRGVSVDEGIPLELLLIVREAMGFAQADADDRMRDDELQVVPIIALQLARGFDPAVIERWIRVYGDNLRRITETETDWWHTQVSLPSLEAGLTEAEMLRATNRFGHEFASLTEQALLAIYRANQEHTWTENTIRLVEDALDRAGLWRRIATTPAICFLDLSGYTRLTEERGDRAAAELVSRLASIVQRPADRHGGKVVKRLGDGVMFHFRDALGASRSALDMLDAVADAALPPAHVGIDTGPVVFEGGDYYGRTVNLAARIAEHAGPGQALVSQTVVDRVQAPDVAFEPIGPVRLDGVPEPLTLHGLRRNPATPPTAAL
jgi:adenylate cyclase